MCAALRLHCRSRIGRGLGRLGLRMRGIVEGMGRAHPARLVALGYLMYVVVGWILLCLPWAQRAAGAGALDHLFTATSAVSTTGLVTVSVADRYTFFGQLVIAFLIQLGGIGYMTVGSFIILSRSREISPTRLSVGRVVFSLPESFDVRSFILSVVKFTAVIEAVGAILLYVVLRRAGEANPLWSAVFHSVSAFCTAGFGLHNNSFETYVSHTGVNLIIAVLSTLGAVGFIVCVDFARMLRGRSACMTMTSRIILHATLWLTISGTILFFLIEPSIRALPPEKRLLAAFFQCMTALTTVGFNTIGIGGLSKATLLVLMGLMVIGASPSGTGGGLKVTTFSAVFGVMRSALRGGTEVTFWGRAIPTGRVWLACASLGYYLAALAAGAFLLMLVEPAPFDALLFETASALGTVGLSMGITPSLTAAGKLILILVMFCGRVGLLTLGMALFHHPVAKPPTRDSDLAL